MNLAMNVAAKLNKIVVVSGMFQSRQTKRAQVIRRLAQPSFCRNGANQFKHQHHKITIIQPNRQAGLAKVFAKRHLPCGRFKSAPSAQRRICQGTLSAAAGETDQS
jgi:hypothetical protein